MAEMSFLQRDGREKSYRNPSRARLSKDDSFGYSEYRAICAALDVISLEMRVEDTCELNPSARHTSGTRKSYINVRGVSYRRSPFRVLPLAMLEIDWNF